jgi:Lon protease-like protein
MYKEIEKTSSKLYKMLPNMKYNKQELNNCKQLMHRLKQVTIKWTNKNKKCKIQWKNLKLKLNKGMESG